MLHVQGCYIRRLFKVPMLLFESSNTSNPDDLTVLYESPVSAAHLSCLPAPL